MRILIIDDHPLVRGGVVLSLQAESPEIDLEQADCLTSALKALSVSPRIDLILLDLQLPDTVGTSGLEILRQRHPRIPVMMLSATLDRGTIDRCLRAGAAGYLPKTLPGDRLGAAVRAVAGGGLYLPREAEGLAGRAWGGMNPAAADQLSELGLTDRQIDVLKLVMRGLPNKLIGRQLQLAEGTVKVHVSAVLRALGARNRTQAVLAANRLGVKSD